MKRIPIYKCRFERDLSILFLFLTGCYPPVRGISLHNEIFLPQTVVTKTERDEKALGWGLVLGNGDLKRREYYGERLTISVRGTGGVFLNARKDPLDLFVSTDAKSLQGEVRFFPIKEVIIPGAGIGGLSDLNGDLRPFITGYLNLPFENANVYISARWIQTIVYTNLSWTDYETGFSGKENNTWEGEAGAFTVGLNHRPTTHIGILGEVTYFDIYKGLKDYSWPWEYPRPHLIEMPLKDLRISMGVYVRIP